MVTYSSSQSEVYWDIFALQTASLIEISVCLTKCLSDMLLRAYFGYCMCQLTALIRNLSLFNHSVIYSSFTEWYREIYVASCFLFVSVLCTVLSVLSIMCSNIKESCVLWYLDLNNSTKTHALPMLYQCPQFQEGVQFYFGMIHDSLRCSRICLHLTSPILIPLGHMPSGLHHV